MTKQKTQILMIHGGETFRTRKDYVKYLKTRTVRLEKYVSWAREYMDEKLGKDFQIIRPEMPLKHNAHYEDWKIHFERHFPLLKNNIILIGGSLGGIFLARYLSENKFPKKILATYLVCPPFDNSLPGEDLVNGFRLKSDLSRLEKQGGDLNLFFSKDDPTVPPLQAEKYRRKLKKANVVIYDDKNGHFQVEKFPEIVRMIKKYN